MPLKPSFRIEKDPRKNYMRLTFLGHMDHATVDGFEQEMAEAFAAMPSREGQSGGCLFLADIRSSRVQSRDISDRLQAIIAHYGSLTRRIAMLVSGSSLEMLQAKRVAGRDRTAFFLSEDDAVVWLFGDTVSVSAPV